MRTSPLHEPPRGSGLKRYADHIASMTDKMLAAEDPNERLLGMIREAQREPRSWKQPWPVYRDYTLRAELEEAMGEFEVARFYAMHPRVVDQLAEARRCVDRLHAGQALRDWQPGPQVETHISIVLTAYLDEFSEGTSGRHRSRNDLYDAVAERLGITRYVVRRAVMKHLHGALTGPEAELNSFCFRVLSQVMAEADRRGPGRFAAAMSA